MQKTSENSIRKVHRGTETSEISIFSTKNAQLAGSKKSSSTSIQEEEKQELALSDTPAPLPTKRFIGKKTESIDEQEKRYEEYILRNNPLFATVVGSPSDTKPIRSPHSDILITGFGLRNLQSLQDALQQDEEKRMRQLYMTKSQESCLSQTEAHDMSRASWSEYYGSAGHSEAVSQTELSSSMSTASQKSFGQRKRLEYLMGIIAEGEEAGEQAEKQTLDDIIYEEEEKGVEEQTGTTAAMKQAQKYLKSHKIFEFFQFLIANMLSNLPENPIGYLLQLMDKCLVYRSGFGEPPLLYTRRHIEQLFYLMDPMKTDFIEVKQYNTGMATMGICTYNKQPPLSADGMVSKMVFIEEAYERLTDLLNDMIRRRWVGNPPPVTPPPTPQVFNVGSCSEEGFFCLSYNKT